MNRMLYHIIYITIFIYLLSACTNQEKQDSTILSPELQQVEAIMYQSPDSAFQLLQNMPVPSISDSLQYATWALFTTQAKYKLYMKQSDSLINMAYPYFLRHGDAQRKALALYYKAIICEEQNKTEEAQKFCLEAAKEVEKTTDYQLGHLIYQELVLMYGLRNLNEYALRAVDKELEYAQKSGTHLYISNGYKHKGRLYRNLNKYNDAISWYKKAIALKEDSLQNNIPKYKSLSTTIMELAEIYNLTEKYDSTLYYMHQAMKLKKEYKIEVYSIDYRIIGMAYYNKDNLDSATYYFNKALNVPNTPIVHIAEAQQALYLAYKKKHEYKKASEHCFQFCVALDSLNRMEKSQALIEMQEKYNQQKLINERNELQIQKDRVIRNALMGLLIAACVIAILIYFYQRKLRKGEREIQEAKEEANKKSLQIQENELIISRNLKRMKELTEQIEANKGLQEELEEQKLMLAEIRRQNETLEQKNKALLEDMEKLSGTLDIKRHDLKQLKELLAQNTYLHNREWDLFCRLMKQDKLLGTLRKRSQPIKDNEWEDIVKAMDDYWDNFTQRLTKTIPSLTKNDLYLCCLMKLRLSTPEIVTLLSIEPNSVYRRKNRLKERIMQEANNWEENMTLDLWIWNF